MKIDLNKLIPWVFILAFGVLAFFLYGKVTDNSDKIIRYKADMELLDFKVRDANLENERLLQLIENRDLVTDSLYKLIKLNDGKLRIQKQQIKRREGLFKNGTDNYRDSLLFQYVRSNQ